ncbi:MAG: XdhC family protein, partial [Acidimicrobiales bacterium]
MEDIARQIAEWLAAGRGVTTGRVIGIEGFSTWPGSQLVAFDDSGGQTGEVLGPPGTDQLQPAAAALRTSGSGRRIVDVEIRGQDVTAAGLSCGGRAQVLMESATSAPARLWTVLAGRAPAVLVTPLDSGGAPSTLVEPGGATSGPEAPMDLVDLAAAAFRSGRSGVQRPVREDGTAWLVQSWVPTPRLVVVGAGDLVGAIEAQAGLLGWEAHALERGDLTPELAWAGGSAAVVVLSHDPHVDSPALQAALEAGVPYVGAMGSRATQS